MSDPKPQTNLYTVGGAVQAGGGLYLARRADDELLELCRAGNFGYVLTPRQMGKTSLMVRTAERLGEEGVQSVIIDLTQIGVQVTVENWYLGLLAVIEDQLMLKTSAVKWWRERAEEGLTQRLVEFFKDVLLKEVEGRVVVFVDEIDTTLSLSFTDDFYAATRYFYNARAHTPELKRLSFVLIGVATPSDLVRDPQRTPFNIGHRVDLTDFTPEEASPLADGLGLPPEESRKVLGWVMEWTGGHPYLTQRLCRAVAEEKRAAWTREDVGRLTESVFFGEMSEKDNNLQFVRDMLTKRAPDLAGVLSTYREVLRGRRPVPDEEQSIVKSHLKLSGIVHRKGGALRVRNPIYGKVFDSHWVSQHLPVNWTKRLQRIAAALVLLILVGLIPLSIYAFAKKRAAEEQRERAEAQAKNAEQQAAFAQAQRQEAVKQGENALAAREEAERQREMAVLAAAKEKTAHAEAEKQRRVAEEQRARAEQEARRANQQAALAEERGKDAMKARDEAERLRQLAFSGQLGALAEVTRNQQSNLLQRSIMIARESILQSPEAPPLIGYQALSQGLTLLPRLGAEFQTQVTGIRHVYSADNKYLVSVSEDPPQTGAATFHTIRVLDVNDGYREVPSLTRRVPVGGSMFSPGLTHLVTKKADGTGTVTDLTTGREVASFTIPKGAVFFDLSNGGKLAAFSDSGQQAVGVRDLTANSVVSSWKEEGSVFGLVFSPAGKYLLVDKDRGSTRSGGRWTVVLREVATGRELGHLEASDQSFTYPSAEGSYYFSPDDEYVAELEESRHVVIRRAAEFEKPIARLEHPSTVQRIVFGPANERLATLGDDNILRVWSIPGVLINNFKLDAKVTDIVFSPDAKSVAAVSDDGSARVWDVSDGSEVARVLQGDLSDFFFGPGGKLITADASGKARVWEAESGRDFIHKTIAENMYAWSLTPDGKYLARLIKGVPPVKAGAKGYRFVVWDTTAPGETLPRSIDAGEVPEGEVIRQVDLSADGNYIAATTDAAVRVWEASSRRLVGEIKTDPPGEEVAVGPGGKYVAAISHGKAEKPESEARVWEVATGDIVSAVKYEDEVKHLAFSPDGKYFASGNRKVQVVRLDGGHRDPPPIPTRGFIGAMVFSPHGKYLALGGLRLNVWAADTGQSVTLGVPGYSIDSIAFSEDERYLAAGASGTEKLARVWQVQSALKDPKYEGVTIKQDGTVFVLALTRDGSRLATVSEGNYARIWDVGVGREIARVPYRGTRLFGGAVAFTGENDKYLVAAQTGGTAEVWLWRPSDLAEAACSRLTLEETPETFLKEYLDEQLLKNMPLLGGCPKQK